MAVGAKRKRVLLVLFIPSVERDGETPIDQRAAHQGEIGLIVDDEYLAITDFGEE